MRDSLEDSPLIPPTTSSFACCLSLRWHFDGNMAISQIIKFYEQSPTRGIGASSEKSLSLPPDMKSRYTTLKSAPPIELACFECFDCCCCGVIDGGGRRERERGESIRRQNRRENVCQAAMPRAGVDKPHHSNQRSKDYLSTCSFSLWLPKDNINFCVRDHLET